MRPTDPDPTRTALARLLGTTDMSLLRYLNRQSLGVGAVPDIHLFLQTVTRVFDLDLKLREEFPKYRSNEDPDSHSKLAAVKGRRVDTNEDTWCFVSPVSLKYASTSSLLWLLNQNVAASVLLWVYESDSRDKHVRMWYKIARHEKWAREETKELLAFLGYNFDFTKESIPELLLKVAKFPEVSTRGGLKTIRRNTLFYLIIEALENMGLKQTQAIWFLTKYLPGVSEDKIGSALKMVSKVLSGRYLAGLLKKTEQARTI